MNPIDYTIAVEYLPRLIAAVYFTVFASFLFQIKGLLGANGILPIQKYLTYLKHRLGISRFYHVPSLFWINSSDIALLSVVWAGMIVSLLLLIFNVYPPVLLALLFILHLSIVSTGQDFLSFGWEMYTLEITFNAILLSLATPANHMAWLSINFLLFRFFIQAGAVKLQSGDKSWRDLTAIKYHYQTQPIPNAVAWYVYKLPMLFHKLSTLIMFIIELVVPFAMLGDETTRLGVFACFFGLQLAIYATGNFSYLNHITSVLSTILLGNAYLEKIGLHAPQPHLLAPAADNVVSAIALVLIVLQAANLWNHFMPNAICARLLNWVRPFHLANRFGIFAIMTTKRYEIVIEGSYDGMEWKEYGFYYKPSELTRRPRRISPFQPRLDWQVWFLPFETFEASEWYQMFLVKLLQGNQDVLKLIRHNPFPNAPPRHIRTQMYEYEYSDWQTRKKTGQWWTRKLLFTYSPPISLKKPQK